jgi:ribosomal protein S18 acetylase RimI-like enzyme
VTASERDDQVLDNAVWHALGGPQARFAESDPSGRARRFPGDLAFFCAVESPDEAGWEALAALAGPEGAVVLFRDEVPPAPRGWTELFRGYGWQLVARDLPPPPPVEVVTLGPDDVGEMLALALLTEPGPFFERTIELGAYVGVRRNGRLVAMAGERLRLPGWVEVSAVCTHPDARRQGLACDITLHVAHAIRGRGDEAFLHVLGENESALRLYGKLGFEVRRKIDVVAAQWGGEQGPT